MAIAADVVAPGPPFTLEEWKSRLLDLEHGHAVGQPKAQIYDGFWRSIAGAYATLRTQHGYQRVCGCTTERNAYAIYLGELPVGYCIARMHAKTSYLESAPVHFLTDPPGLAKVSDADLTARA